jgi:hypothetical protein
MRLIAYDVFYSRNLFIIYCCLQRCVVTPEKQPGPLSKRQQRELCVACSVGHLFNVTRRGVFGG